MKKTQNILTAIIVIALIALIGIVVWISYNQIITSKKEAESNTTTTASNEVNNNTSIKDEKEEQEVDTPIESEDKYVGKEEEESDKEEDTEKTKDEKALELAKEKWGEDDSVTFSIERKDGNLYYIAVKSNATTVSWYKIDTNTWEISDYY